MQLNHFGNMTAVFDTALNDINKVKNIAVRRSTPEESSRCIFGINNFENSMPFYFIHFK